MARGACGLVVHICGRLRSTESTTLVELGVERLELLVELLVELLELLVELLELLVDLV
jgi:hypothetical protein